jgi:hypothetical protein
LTLAFWRFQGLAAATLFTAAVQAIEARARAELDTDHPGGFRHKSFMAPCGATTANEKCLAAANSGTTAVW